VYSLQYHTIAALSFKNQKKTLFLHRDFGKVGKYINEKNISL